MVRPPVACDPPFLGVSKLSRGACFPWLGGVTFPPLGASLLFSGVLGFFGSDAPGSLCDPDWGLLRFCLSSFAGISRVVRAITLGSDVSDFLRCKTLPFQTRASGKMLPHSSLPFFSTQHRVSKAPSLPDLPRLTGNSFHQLRQRKGAVLARPCWRNLYCRAWCSKKKILILRQRRTTRTWGRN